MRQPVYEQMGRSWAEMVFQNRPKVKKNTPAGTPQPGDFWYDHAKITLSQMGLSGAALDAAAVEVCEAASEHWGRLTKGVG